MRFWRLGIKSVISFIKQEKILTFWIYTGMGFASLMILICSASYFTKKTNSKQEQLQSNRYEFVFENSVEKISGLIDMLKEDEGIENICIDIIQQGDVQIEAWKYPEQAFIKETIISGKYPDNTQNKNWCMISQNFQWKKQMMEEEVPLVNENLLVYGNQCYCTAVTISNDYDVLIDMELMEQLLQENSDPVDVLETRISYIYNDDRPEVELESINSSIINSYNPAMVIRNERTKSYSFFSYIKEISSLILLMFLAVINYSIIYDYWIKKRYRTYQVFRICGLSLSVMIRMVFLEQILHFIMIHSIVSVAYILASITVFHQILDNLPVLIIQCVFAGGVLLGINILIFIIMGIKTKKVSILEMYKGGE